jgi:heat shock protein HslJ
VDRSEVKICRSAALVIGVVLAACASAPNASFQDIAYTIDGEPVRLEKGVSEREAAPGSAGKVVTRHFGHQAEGDLDGDGNPDVAFLLTQDAGGTGTFFYLVGAIRTEAGFRGTRAAYLGDRIAPQGTEIRDGTVVVNYAEHRPGEPMVGTPSVRTSAQFRYQPKTDGFERADEATRRVGLYEYLADAASFTDCATDLRVPVALESDHAALERAYLAARREVGERMLVTLKGRIEARPRVDGEDAQDFLVVTRHEQVWPAESCEKSALETPLENTFWRLVELEGAPLEMAPPPPREVHIRLRPGERRLVGFFGCNEATGRYEIEGDRLQIELLASTRTACPRLSQEAAFTGALARVRRFLILGESLVLSSDAADVARFEALYLP